LLACRADAPQIPSLPTFDEDRNDFTLLASEEKTLDLTVAAVDQLEETLNRQLSVRRPVLHILGYFPNAVGKRKKSCKYFAEQNCRSSPLAHCYAHY
jgi:hypothetical protein